MKIKTLSIFALLLFLICCSSQAQSDYKYSIPEKINDGLEVSSLSAQGIDSTGGNYEKSLAHTQASQITDNYILKATVK